MNTITFDVTYKKKTETSSIKLSSDCEFQQLKIMLCGKYKIYDISTLYIYYKNVQITNDDFTKLRDIFKTQRVRIEISDTQIKIPKKIYTNHKNPEPIEKDHPIDKNQSLCKYCKKFATCICDKCEELLCNICSSKKKHFSHSNQIIKISEYKIFFKTLINNFGNDLEKKIINDEGYRFLKYFNYDIEHEISNINNIYEFIKKQLEDIKQIQIDYILSFNETSNQYETLNKQIELTALQYNEISESFNSIINAKNVNYEKIFEQKKIITNCNKNIFEIYNKIKDDILLYSNTIKDIQLFNQEVFNYIKEKFNYNKKKYNNQQLNNTSSNFNKTNKIITNNTKQSETPSNNNFISNSNINANINVNLNLNSPKMTHAIENRENNFIAKENNSNGGKSNNRYLSPMIQKNNDDTFNLLSDNKNMTCISNLRSPLVNKNNDNNIKGNIFNMNNSMVACSPQRINNEKMIYKIKDDRNVIIFSINTMSFKERTYLDKCGFNKETVSEEDISQINLFNKLFLLSGKNHNKFYFYNYYTNCINFINNTLYNHYYGSFVYCDKYNMLYLIGGNKQINNEICYINNNNIKKITWNTLPPLNEERQEFASLYYNDYIYIFFGYSSKNECNLSSIERINVNTNDKFEVVYINEQISLSSLACAKFSDGCGNNCILLLGGFDGEKYSDNCLLLNVEEMKIRDCDINIPNNNKCSQFLFQIESAFIEIEPGIQALFDMKNNIHLLNRDSYELFSEV